MKMRRTRRRKRRINGNKLGVVAITMAVALICVVMTFQIIGLRKSNLALEEKKEALEEILEEENQRSEELEEEKVYVQTDEYFEDVARSAGYIYPNEIIFKPDTSH